MAAHLLHVNDSLDDKLCSSTIYISGRVIKALIVCLSCTNVQNERYDRVDCQMSSDYDTPVKSCSFCP